MPPLLIFNNNNPLHTSSISLLTPHLVVVTKLDLLEDYTGCHYTAGVIDMDYICSKELNRAPQATVYSSWQQGTFGKSWTIQSLIEGKLYTQGINNDSFLTVTISSPNKCNLQVPAKQRAKHGVSCYRSTGLKPFFTLDVYHGDPFSTNSLVQ